MILRRPLRLALAIGALAVASLFCASKAFGAPSPRALELRDLALAALENETPEQAESLYRELIAALPDDPLGHANLAIAHLRQQEYTEALAAVDAALALAPGRGDLLALRGEVLQWSGALDEALATMDRATETAPNDLEILYSAYSLATTLDGEVAEQLAWSTLEQLALRRPENVVVLLQLGQRAIARDDRTVATAAFLRIGELLWQANDMTRRAHQMVLDALIEATAETGLESARVPAVRLENVLKITPMFRESLRELKTGIQGIPLRHLEGELVATDASAPDPAAAALAVTFSPRRLAGEGLGASQALAVGDFDGDERPDLAHALAAGGVALRLSTAEGGLDAFTVLPSARLGALAAIDLDNDGALDLVGSAREAAPVDPASSDAGSAAPRDSVWRGDGTGAFEAVPDRWGVPAGFAAIEAIDFDIEGDLDLALAGGPGGSAQLLANALQGALEPVGARALPALPYLDARAVRSSDLDGDGDLDLLLGHARGLTWLDNLRQGRFTDRTARAGIRPSAALEAVDTADLDADGHLDLIGAGSSGLQLWRGDGADGFVDWPTDGPWGLTPSTEALVDVLAFDADNDGRLEIATLGVDGRIAVHRLGGALEAAPLATEALADAPTPTESEVGGTGRLAAADLDLDGDLDLVATGPLGLRHFENQGGSANKFLVLRLRGLDRGNSKNNLFGVGSLVEIRDGERFQLREARGDSVHFGLGQRETAAVVRVVWTNGVPQNRTEVAGDQRLVEEQLLKGSCPFLYTWNGERFAFVTDLLWGAPIGLPAAPGVWISSDPSELVRVDGAVPEAGEYHLRITEELWEAAFFDRLRLWVVDHPDDVEVASSLRIVPGAATPERVLGTRKLRPVAQAIDGRGQDVTARVAERDEVYADGYTPSPYQGVARPWTFTFDLGEPVTGPLRLHLDGWIFPSDASLNLAVAQRDDYPPMPPQLEVETADGWRPVDVTVGFPAGKTKTMVVDIPDLARSTSTDSTLADSALTDTMPVRRLRLVTSLWLHWDRVAWSVTPADEAPHVVAKLEATTADLRFRGFSTPRRTSPNGPHVFDYEARTAESPWLPFPGHYTRYGDVRPLLTAAEDFSVVLAPGDEIALTFDASALDPPAPGFRRTVFLESHGWDKDADRNTGAGQQLEPLPFHAMSGYPYTEPYPDTPGHRHYLEHWQTREIESASPWSPAPGSGSAVKTERARR